jgi:hypothetical protein
MVSAVSAGIWRARGKRRLEAEEEAMAPSEPVPVTEEPMEIVDWSDEPQSEAAPPKEAPRSAAAPPKEAHIRAAAHPAEPPEIGPPEPAAAKAMPLLRSEAYESEMETVDMGPPAPESPIGPPPRTRPAPPPKAEAAAQRTKMAGKTVDADIDDILSRIDSISQKR